MLKSVTHFHCVSQFKCSQQNKTPLTNLETNLFSFSCITRLFVLYQIVSDLSYLHDCNITPQVRISCTNKKKL